MTLKLWNELTHSERVDRWEHAIKVIDGLNQHEREKHFDMGDWGRETECGTVACAAGHCGLDPKFRQDGFQMNFETKQYLDGYEYRTLKFTTQPEDFFGKTASNDIFTNGDILIIDDPLESHAAVIKAMKAYLEELKAKASCVI